MQGRDQPATRWQGVEKEVEQYVARAEDASNIGNRNKGVQARAAAVLEAVLIKELSHDRLDHLGDLLCRLPVDAERGCVFLACRLCHQDAKGRNARAVM